MLRHKARIILMLQNDDGRVFTYQDVPTLQQRIMNLVRITMTELVRLMEKYLLYLTPVVYGCMDAAAQSTYNPNATLDDGSCVYNAGCLNSLAEN